MELIYLANLRLPTEKAHGIQIMKMCQALALTGLEVELIVPWRFNKIKKDPFDYYGIKKNFKIRKLPSLDLVGKISRLGFWIQNMTFALSIFFYLLFRKTDYIYSRNLFSLWILSFFKKNLIYEAHSFPEHFWLYQSTLKRIKGLIIITQKLKEFYQKKGIAQGKILVAPDGVDLEEFNIKESKEECRRKLNLPLDRKIIGYVGQLKTMGIEKGIADLIKATRIVGHALCLVGGQQSDIMEYKKLTRGLDIIFVGQIQHKLIPCYLKSFDVLVMPFPWTEHYAYYMSPLKMFEYMAAQKPIVASNLPSIREILDKNNAILVQLDSPQRLARGIEMALENTDLAAKISRQAFKDVGKYTWSKRADNIIKFIS